MPLPTLFITSNMLATTTCATAVAPQSARHASERRHTGIKFRASPTAKLARAARPSASVQSRRPLRVSGACNEIGGGRV